VKVSLRGLRLLQCGGKTPLLQSMPLLETVSIDLSCYECKDKCGGCPDESCEGCHGYPVGSYRSVLLNILSNAINLELKDQPEVVCFLLPLILYSVSTLTVAIQFYMRKHKQHAF
jgi:hypothetical protein